MRRRLYEGTLLPNSQPPHLGEKTSTTAAVQYEKITSAPITEVGDIFIEDNLFPRNSEPLLMANSVSLEEDAMLADVSSLYVCSTAEAEESRPHLTEKLNGLVVNGIMDSDTESPCQLTEPEVQEIEETMREHLVGKGNHLERNFFLEDSVESMDDTRRFLARWQNYSPEARWPYDRGKLFIPQIPLNSIPHTPTHISPYVVFSRREPTLVGNEHQEIAQGITVNEKLGSLQHLRRKATGALRKAQDKAKQQYNKMGTVKFQRVRPRSRKRKLKAREATVNTAMRGTTGPTSSPAVPRE